MSDAVKGLPASQMDVGPAAVVRHLAMIRDCFVRKTDGRHAGGTLAMPTPEQRPEFHRRDADGEVQSDFRFDTDGLQRNRAT
jgi:hypothetical protein